MEYGPILPEHLNDPCVKNINETSYFITSSEVYHQKNDINSSLKSRNITAWIYDFKYGGWINVIRGNPCSHVLHNRLMCAKYGSLHIVLAIPSDGTICTAIFNIQSLEWMEKKELLVRNPQKSIIINPINDEKEVVLINEGVVYQMIDFTWQFQWRNNVEVNVSAFVGISMYKRSSHMRHSYTQSSFHS